MSLWFAVLMHEIRLTTNRRPTIVILGRNIA